MREMRMVVCAVVHQLDLRFDEMWDEEEWERGLQDMFVLVKGRLPVVVTLRKW